ncbi:MAG: multicopper oxidase domain-containing protein, partial [Rubrobacteraceae bacterium]
MELTRKEMLKLSLLGSAALFLPMQRAAKTQLSIANEIPESQLPRPFTLPFAVPPVAKPVHRSATTDYYQMAMRNKKAEILPGLQTEVWGYEGITPGPTIVAERGREVVVRHSNEIWNRDHRWTSVHLHGNASLPQYDGYASDITKPGEFKDYHFPNGQDARTLWYHDHGVHDTALNAYMGCAAFYISHDELEQSLPIPKGKYDVPLVLRDATFATDGSLIFDDQGESNLYGNVILANGVPWPKMKVERRKYRFRLLNASISRSFDLALSSDEPFTVIGTDGGLMPEPKEVGNMRFGMAERYEIVIDFAKYNVGDQIVLKNLQPKNNQEFLNTDVIMRFDVVGEASDRKNNQIPSELNPENHVMQLDESQAVRTRKLSFQRDNGLWTINGETWHDVIASDFKSTVGNPGLNDVE